MRPDGVAWQSFASGDHNSTVSDGYTDKLNKKFPVKQKFSCGNKVAGSLQLDFVKMTVYDREYQRGSEYRCL